MWLPLINGYSWLSPGISKTIVFMYLYMDKCDFNLLSVPMIDWRSPVYMLFYKRNTWWFRYIICTYRYTKLHYISTCSYNYYERLAYSNSTLHQYWLLTFSRFVRWRCSNSESLTVRLEDGSINSIISVVPQLSLISYPSVIL